MSGFTAVYDASVLYPSELRNLLMHLALMGLFRVKWSGALPMPVSEAWIIEKLSDPLKILARFESFWSEGRP